VNIEPDQERVLAAQTARAEAEAQRILHAALEQAATLQVEMSKEIEAQTQRRISIAEREIAERLAQADREAEERVRQSVDTAAALLLNARKEADKLHEELAAEARDTIRREPAAEANQVGELLDEAQQAAVARLSEADAFAEQRIAETVQWCKTQIAEADQIGAQRLLEAEIRAQEIIERARTDVATLTFPPDERATEPWLHDRPPRPGDGIGSPQTVAKSDVRRRFPRLVTTARVVVLVVVAVIGTDLLRSCVAEPYTVASTSMEPAFHDGDRLVVNKLAYRWGDVGRGDIVVFDTSRVSGETRELGPSLVKRVIGLPGEVVQGIGGKVLIDGNQIEEPWLGEVQTPPFGPVQVPDDSLFVLGDARGVSIDSRTFGTVPINALVGQVEAVVWPPGDAKGI
jgi:signal peptidase I